MNWTLDGYNTTDQIYELRSRFWLVTLEDNWTEEEAWDSRPKSLMEIETALASGGGDDEAMEGMIVNTVVHERKIVGMHLTLK